MIRLQREIGPGGLLIANPMPEAHALEEATIEERIAEAVAEARAQGVGKKQETPFLLRPHRRTDRRAQPRGQMALVKNNATLAAQIAVELARV